MSTRLDGKRVLLTQASEFMGPALQETFRNLGATVMADERALDQDPLLPAALVQAAGKVDVLLLHLALAKYNFILSGFRTKACLY